MKREPSALTLLEKVLTTNPLTQFTGSEEFASLLPFLQGVAYGLNAAGVYDSRYQAFLSWLLKNGMALQQGGWTAYFLQAAGGDDQKARGLFLSALHRFTSEKSSESNTPKG